MCAKQKNLVKSVAQSNEVCSACKDLLMRIEQFFDVITIAHRQLQSPEWLTVDDIAKELKISKSIVYRLIRNGEIEAINVVETNGRMAQKGHYRISRPSLNEYLESKKVKSPPAKSNYGSRPAGFQNVKNHLGI